MEEIKNQVPDNITDTVILDCYIKNNSNVVSTIMELWDIKEKKIVITDEQKKWKELRDTCDLFDNEMYNMIHNRSKKDCDTSEIDCNVSKYDCKDDNIEVDIKG